ncbi:MAG: EamA family transporter [Candidatus Bathyarchaeia archaeon]
MDWFAFALLSPAFWGINNIFYKFLMTKKFQGYYSMIIYLNFIDLIFAGIVCVVSPISFQLPYAVFAMLVGVMPVLSFWFYSKALLVEEISRITPLFQFIPIFVVMLSMVFLGEILSAQKYLGIALIVATSLLVSYRKSENGGSLSSAFKWMMPFCVILSVYNVFNKYLLAYIDSWSVFFWMMVGSFFAVLVMLGFSKPRKEFSETVQHDWKTKFVSTVTCEGLYFLGTICSLIAMSGGYVSIVSALSGLQYFFVFLFMVVLSLFVPQFLKEEIHRKAVALKAVAVVLMFVGTWILTV